jgi:hypothetical protein
MKGDEVVGNAPIRCYDNGGKTFDRYTVYYMDWKCGQFTDGRSMSVHPFMPNGFGLFINGLPGSHNGKRIRFADLPPDCQKCVLQDLKD